MVMMLASCGEEFNRFPTLRLDDPVVMADRAVLTARFDLNDIKQDRIKTAGFNWGTSAQLVERTMAGTLEFTQASGSFSVVLDSLNLLNTYYYQAFISIEGEGVIHSPVDTVRTGEVRIETNYGSTRRRTDTLDLEEIQLFGFISGLRDDAIVDSFGHVWLTFDDQQAVAPTFSVEEALAACNSCFTSTIPSSVKTTFTDTVRLDYSRYHYIQAYVSYQGQYITSPPIELFIGNFWRRQSLRLPVPLTNAVSFVIDDKAYLLTGTRLREFFGPVGQQLYYRGMIVCDLNDDSIRCETLFDTIPLLPRIDATAFTLDGYGYVGSGRFDSLEVYNDFWRFDPQTQSWEELEPLELSVFDAVSFVVDGKAYIGTGNKGTNNLNGFDPTGAICIYTNPGWVLGGIPFSRAVSNAVSWSMDNEVFVGMGHVSNGAAPLTREVYRFDETLDFQPLPMFDGPARQSAVAFSIGNQAYMGTGSAEKDGYLPTYNDFWVFDRGSPELGWFQIDNMGSNLVSNATAFSLGGKGYVVGGLIRGSTDQPAASSIIWEYTPANQ